ncbi:MAG: twitching motility protein PilT [Anaerolineae bacterium]
MKTYVVDTRTLIWYLDNDPRLGTDAEAALDDANVHTIIPIIVMAEIKYLSHKGRFTRTMEQTLQVISLDPRCTIYPVDLSVVNKAPLDLNIHDSLIVGTALVQRETVTGVLTRDEAIVSSGLVPTVC